MNETKMSARVRRTMERAGVNVRRRRFNELIKVFNKAIAKVTRIGDRRFRK